MSSAWKLEEITPVRCICFSGTAQEPGDRKVAIMNAGSTRSRCAEDASKYSCARLRPGLALAPATASGRPLLLPVPRSEKIQPACRRPPLKTLVGPDRLCAQSLARKNAAPIHQGMCGVRFAIALFGRLQTRAVRPAIDVLKDLLVTRPRRRLLVLGASRLLDFLAHQRSPFLENIASKLNGQ